MAMVDNAVVGRWIRVWVRAWRSEPLVLVSPLPVPAVRARLIEGRTTYLRAAFTFAGFGGYRVVGRVGERRIVLEAAAVGVRNTWRPVLRGRLEPEGTGSRLVGRLGWSPFVKAFSALWLTIVGSAFVGITLRAVAVVWSGEATGGVFLYGLIPLGMLLFFVGLTAWGIQLGRRAIYLRSWLGDRLQTAESGIPGYRPWQENTPY